MPTEELVILGSRLVVGASATFLSILIWSRTRDVAWMFIVIGTIASYGEAMYSALLAFGMVTTDLLRVGDVSIFRVLVTNLPTLFYIAGFLALLVRRTLR